VRRVGVLRLLRCPLAVMVLVLEVVMVLRKKNDGVWGMHLKGSGVHCDMKESKAGKEGLENFSIYIYGRQGLIREAYLVSTV
jgi:hypothetical protein